MPRHLRVQFPGAIYHVTIRGNGKNRIFEDDHDRERFLERLAGSVETYRARLYLFCLMSNHVHLLLETPSGNLSRFMQSLETGYTVYYNLRHKSSGHVLQGRYGAKVVDGDEYLLKLSRYVHLNPVNVGAVKSRPLKEKVGYLRRYAWSSYRGYIGEAKKLEYVTYGPILWQMGVRRSRRQREYREYVEQGLADTDTDLLELLKESRRSIGGESFRRWVDELYWEQAGKLAHAEDIDFRPELGFLGAGDIMKTVARRLGTEVAAFRVRRRDSLLRPIAGMMLVKYGGLTRRDAGKELGIASGSAVGYAAKRVRTLAEKERKVAKLVAGIEAELGLKTRASNGK